MNEGQVRNIHLVLDGACVVHGPFGTETMVMPAVSQICKKRQRIGNRLSVAPPQPHQVMGLAHHKGLGAQAFGNASFASQCGHLDALTIRAEGKAMKRAHQRVVDDAACAQ